MFNSYPATVWIEHTLFTATRPFHHQWKKLSASQQRQVQQKLILLIQNPAHPSLRVHALYHHHSKPAIKECYVSKDLRILYST